MLMLQAVTQVRLYPRAAEHIRGVIGREACHLILNLEQEQSGTFLPVTHRHERRTHLKSATVCKPIENSPVVSGVQFSF